MPNVQFIDPHWKDFLKEAGYANFDSWWNAKKNLVEVGNFRGPDANTSWSHVSKLSLPEDRSVYVKRQQNHYPNNIILKHRRLATFEIEWKNYQLLKKAGIPTLNIIYFESRKVGGDKQCILVSEELSGMNPIHKLVKWYKKNTWPKREQRKAILIAIAQVIKKMHAAGLSHNALYGRHIYLNIPFEDGSPKMPNKLEVRLIDLERTKSPGPKSPKLITNDLEKMFRRIPQWPARDCIWFLKEYLGIDKLTPRAKEIIRQIAPSRAKT